MAASEICKGYPTKLSSKLRKELGNLQGFYHPGYHITLGNIIRQDPLVYTFDAKWIVRGNPVGVVVKVTPIYSVHVSGKGKRRIIKEWFATSNEIDILDGVNASYIPKLLKSFSEKNFHYLVFEKIEGLTLREYTLSYDIRNGSDGYYNTLNLETALTKLISTFHHNFKCIHRNITPDNIIIGENSRLYLINFEYCVREPGDVYVLPEVLHPDHNYTSIGVMMGNPPSYEDDFESLRYSLYYFNNRTLKWMDKSTHRKILKLKKKFSV